MPTEKRAEYLLTPGPLTTSRRTKEAMLRDLGSRDMEFRELTLKIRRRLLELAGASEGGFECVPLQGSGTFAVEAMIGTLVGPSGKTLVLANGAYGKRAAQMLAVMGRSHTVIDKGDYDPPRAAEVCQVLAADPSLTHVFAVHCETSSGIVNPLGEIADAVHSEGRRLLVDSMSAFGALPLDASKTPFDAMACSANKCFEGVPGLGFVIVRRDALDASAGNAHSLSLDLHQQWKGLEASAQWRFTPPTHVASAFVEALAQHEEEGGQQGRLRRYERNKEVLVDGMRRLGFRTLLPDEWLSPIIVTFLSPSDPAFDFETFYRLLKDRGFVIYPGKLTEAETFRMGCIGDLDEAVMRRAVDAVESALNDLGVSDASPSPAAAAA